MVIRILAVSWRFIHVPCDMHGQNWSSLVCFNIQSLGEQWSYGGILSSFLNENLIFQRFLELCSLSRAGSSAKVGYLSCRAQFKVKMVGPFFQEAGKSAISHSNIDLCPSFVVSVMVFTIFCLTSCSFWLCSFGSPLEILAGRGEIFTGTGPLSSLCKTSRKRNKYIYQSLGHPLPIVF